jgi:hypothetical protein
MEAHQVRLPMRRLDTRRFVERFERLLVQPLPDPDLGQ